jgi:hypothetical protein
MGSYFKNVAVAAAMLAAAGFCSSVAKAEPLMTIFEFSQPAYTDTAKTDSIVVTVTRTDQDPSAAANAFAVNCTLIGGTAVQDKDYRLPFTRPASGVWKLTFAPGVKQQSFTIATIKKPGATDKTLQFQLSEPEGSGPAITGSNATATATIVNPRLPPSKAS